MMRHAVLLIVLLSAGCGPVGVVPLGAIAGASGKKGGSEPAPPPAATLDNVLVEGTVADNLDFTPTLRLDGSPVALTGGSFSANLDPRVKSEFLFEAWDAAGNAVERHVRVR